MSVLVCVQECVCECVGVCIFVHSPLRKCGDPLSRSFLFSSAWYKARNEVGLGAEASSLRGARPDHTLLCFAAPTALIGSFQLSRTSTISCFEKLEF